MRRSLTLRASLSEVRVLDGSALIARHRRSFDCGAQIEQAAHIDALRQEKRAGRTHRGIDRLHAAVPQCCNATP